MEQVFGIDLGTTYSCIAQVDEYGKPVVLANFENERTTPSVVFLEDDGSVIVGNEAKNMLKTDPHKVVSFIKRNMGDPNFLFIHNETQYKPEEISSFILKKLVKDAAEKVGFEIKDVVITCPAYFGINEREATKIAGEIAGLNVKSIINEPTAAALTYGIDQVQDQTVLVYDLGGGTFDITMIQVKPQAIDVVVTGGDHNLGGKNWDNALMSYFADKFKEETGIEDDIFSNPETSGDLQINAESAKKTLSQRDKTKVNVLYGTDRVTVEVTKEKFNEITQDLAERTIMLTKQMLEDASKKGFTTFDKILLVGGSTRMPQIKEILEQNFPNTSIESFDPDESVAKGAAIYGQQLALNGELIKRLSEKLGVSEEDIKLDKVSEKELKEAEQDVADKTGLTLGAVKKARTKIGNVVSKSFGILAYVNDSEQKVVNMILKQTTVPAEISQTFATHEANQENVEISVFENELSDNNVEISMSKEIGTGLIDGIPSNLPAGSPIQVTFKINEEGRLDIHAMEMTGKKELNLTVETTSVISGQELEEAKERSKAIKLS
ncbi:MAG: Hsp70 family protein [Bacteroidia bacterium]|nr:Hsp70 family protein [Bacteroidia bacterium]